MTPDSIEQARALMAQGGLDAFSFDIFDTFLLRRSAAPDGVSERAFHLAPIPYRYAHAVESFVQHRMLAEFKARTRKAERGLALEVGIDEVYAQFPTHVYGLPGTARADLAEAELLAEMELCLVNRHVLDLYREARDLGLKVGFLSDTFWSAAQLRRLLDHLVPGLEPDFLYASCEHGQSKSSGLFSIALTAEGIDPARLAHLGDNPVADGVVPRQLGVKTVAYPQAPHHAWAVFQRETVVMRLIQAERAGAPRRLDQGLTTLRRLALGELGADTPERIAAAAVVGPVLSALARLVQAKLSELQGQGRRAKVLFLGRDGYLPLRIWTLLGGAEAHYVEINRRVALVAGADTIAPLQSFLRGMPRVSAVSLTDILKTELPGLEDFFAPFPEGVADGNSVAEALPRLISPETMRAIAADLRGRLLDYLRASVPGFDDATDLVLVDLGYSGTIQRSLRQVLDRAGLPQALHGVYAVSVDDNFLDFSGEDTLSALLDDTVLPPMSKRAILRNVCVLERYCAAPWGSVASYEGGKVVREDDLRPAGQVAFADRVQADALGFAAVYDRARRDWGLDPFATVEAAQILAAMMLSRFLLLPTEAERHALGGLEIDVNLGSKVIATAIDAPYVGRLMGTMPFPKVCGVPQPPMWLAGSIAEVSPFAGYAYALAGFGLVPEDVLNDSAAGSVNAVIVKEREADVTVPVGVANTGFGDLRLRIPVLRKHGQSRVAVPLGRIGQSGMVRSLTIQEGANSMAALNDRHVRPLSLDGIAGHEAEVSGGYFRATGPDPHLLVPAPASGQPLSILTLTVTPFGREVA